MVDRQAVRGTRRVTGSVEASDRAARGIVAAMMIDPLAIPLAAAALRDDAMVGGLAKVYGAIRAIDARGDGVDLLAVAAELERRGEIDGVGGYAALAGLVEYVSPRSNIEAHAALVNEAATARALKRALLESLAEVENPVSVADALDSAERRIMAVRDKRARTTIEPVGSILDRMLAEPRYGVRIGFPRIDDATHGLRGGQLIVLGARPGVGKTAMACRIANNVAMDGGDVWFFSIEMTETEIAQRLVALHGVGMGWARDESSASARDAVARLPIRIVSESGPTVTDMRALLRRHGAGALVIVDYLQIIHPGGRFDSRAQAIDEITVGLKRMAREFEVPVLALAQLNRAMEAGGKIRRPMLSDLRESGSIEAHADVILFVHREKYYDPENNAADGIIAKQRQGPCPVTCPLVFDRYHATFYEQARGSWEPVTNEPEPPPSQGDLAW